jgi:hypothetical protein
MKRSQFTSVCLFAAMGASFILALNGRAADAETPANSVAAAEAPKLPYGAGDVLKLTKAQLSEDVIATYVRNSGTAYNLTASEIVYLKHEGVSDRIINVMQEQKTKMVEASAQAAQVAAAQSVANQAQVAAPANYVQPAPTYVQAPTTYVQPASTAYVVPYPAASAAYYGYSYPYYGGYCGWWPGVSLSFGWGGYYGGRGCYYGGYRGCYGGYHGGYHGGGGHGGHH